MDRLTHLKQSLLFAGRLCEVCAELTAVPREGRADALADAQLDAGLDFTVALDGAVCGLVEAWAGGLAWGELVGQTSLDGGDIFRILRRTTDLLRQVALVPYVSETVQTRARDAYRAMSRYPLGTVGDPVVLEAEGEGEAVTA